MIWGQGGSQGAWGRLPCCHRNNLQPWPWAGVRGQREVTAEAMIMVKGGGGGCGGGCYQIRGAKTRYHLKPAMQRKISSTEGIIGKIYDQLNLY